MKDAIEASRKVKALENSGVSVIRCPDMLLEERFLARLKGGAARKSLNTLGMLSKLVNLVASAAESAVALKGLDSTGGKDVDDVVSKLTVEELCSQMQISLKKPRFLRKVPWWDTDCDRHLILGVFRHGYGRYDLIRKDPELMFKRILEELSDPSKKEGLTQSEASVPFQEEGDTLEGTEAARELDREAGEGDEDAEPSGPDGTVSADGMPETRFLNKLVTLIVCSDLPETRTRADTSVPEGAGDSSLVPTKPSGTDAGKPEKQKSSVIDEMTLLSHLYDYIDIDAIRTSLRSTTYPQLLRSINSEDSNAAEVNISGNSTELHITLNEDDIVRITSSLIIHGAPLMLDGSANAKKSPADELMVYDWVAFINNLRINLRPKYIRYFYESCWLPFCYSISNRKTAFQNRRVIPNPLSKPVEHSLESRGLCHLFLLRQRRLRAVHFLLSGGREGIGKILNRLNKKSPLCMGGEWITPDYDVALLEGCLAYGYMNIAAMRASPSHLFHNIPLTGFPSTEDIEQRLLNILVSGTEQMPLKSYCKVLPAHEHVPPVDDQKRRRIAEDLSQLNGLGMHNKHDGSTVSNDIGAQLRSDASNLSEPMETEIGPHVAQGGELSHRNGISLNLTANKQMFEVGSSDDYRGETDNEAGIQSSQSLQNYDQDKPTMEESDISFGMAKDLS